MENVSKPVLMAVDDEAKALERIEQELRKRYAADYDIFCTQALAIGSIDAYGPRPFSGDEAFHHFVSGFLEAWARKHRPQYEMVQIVGERWSRRAYELRDLLERNGIPYGFYDAGSEAGQAMLVRGQRLNAPQPVVIFADGRTLANPSNSELAEALDVSTIYDITGVPQGRSSMLWSLARGRPDSPPPSIAPLRACTPSLLSAKLLAARRA